MRGVLYVVWGDRANDALERSRASVKKFHPELPIHVARVTPEAGDTTILHKSKMGSLTPFDSTLYLDADTVVMGNLDFGFEQAERFGIACCICECPWRRRYDPAFGDQVEYNTGVLFFGPLGKKVMEKWESVAFKVQYRARTLSPRGLVLTTPEDQAGFAAAMHELNFNPYVLPLNFNLRPPHHPVVYAPIKVWHDYADPPAGLEELSRASEQGIQPVRAVQLTLDDVASPFVPAAKNP